MAPLLRGGTEAAVANLRRACDDLQPRRVRLAVGVSTVHAGLLEVPEAYTEARAAREGLGGAAGVRALPDADQLRVPGAARGRDLAPPDPAGGTGRLSVAPAVRREGATAAVVSSDLYPASTAMVIGYRASRRCRLVARASAARSSTMYQITQLRGKNSPLSHAKRQRWPRRRAPQAASEPTASQTAADRPSVQMPSALTPQLYGARAGGAAPEHCIKSRQTRRSDSVIGPTTNPGHTPAPPDRWALPPAAAR